MFWRKYLHNKYFYTGFIFLIWMLFFDQENFITQYQLSQTLNDLQNKKEFYQTETENNLSIIEKLETDTAWLEKFAREKYFMKKDNEEVFVIIREEN